MSGPYGLSRSVLEETSLNNFAERTLPPAGLPWVKKIVKVARRFGHNALDHLKRFPDDILVGLRKVLTINDAFLLSMAISLLISSIGPNFVCSIWNFFMQVFKDAVDIAMEILLLALDSPYEALHLVGDLFIGICHITPTIFGFNIFGVFCSIGDHLKSLNPDNPFNEDDVNNILDEGFCYGYDNLFFLGHRLLAQVLSGALNAILYDLAWVLVLVGCVAAVGLAMIVVRRYYQKVLVMLTAPPQVVDVVAPMFIRLEATRKRGLRKIDMDRPVRARAVMNSTLRHGAETLRKRARGTRVRRAVVVFILSLGAAECIAVFAVVPALRLAFGWIIIRPTPDIFAEFCTYVCVGRLILFLGIATMVGILFADFRSLFVDALKFSFFLACAAAVLLVAGLFALGVYTVGALVSRAEASWEYKFRGQFYIYDPPEGFMKDHASALGAEEGASRRDRAYRGLAFRRDAASTSRAPR